jgi:hypothetical protein
MIEKLKDLEQEAMDNLDPETYDAIVSNVMEEGEQWIYQSGYIDGLQTAIRILAEESETMSYTVEVEDIFPEDDEERDED